MFNFCCMKLFCFLGNIGTQYEKTRHNVGFLFGDFLQKEWGASNWKIEKKFFGEICEVRQRIYDKTSHSEISEKIIFLKPHTFMNLSGKSLLSLMQFYKIPAEDITIFYDDKDLDFSVLRYREKGSAGGHNGIKDIIRVLGVPEFSRWKIGVDSPMRQKIGNTADFVLGKFSGTEFSELENIFLELEGKLKKP